MKERSFFWPFVMIATGFIWLMVSMGRIPSDNLWALTQVWPYLLMILGVGLIIRSFWRPAGMFFSGFIVLAAVLSILFAPQLGWNEPQNWNGMNFNLEADFTGGVPGSGVVVSEKRELPAFTGVVVRYPAEVIIRQGSTDSVTLKGDDNLLPQMTTQVSDGILVIDILTLPFSKRVDPNEGILITITARDLRQVDFPSAGKITLEGIQSDQMKLNLSGAGEISMIEVGLGTCDFHLSGAGSIHANGSADSLDVNISGAGSFEGSDFKVKSALVAITGLGSAEVWVVSNLDARISGMGSINYYGNPSVQRNVSGLGSVNGLGEK
jgi:hypothetical protein